MNFSKVAKDASKPAVSWLNFEPKVSKFPSNSSHSVAAVTHNAIRSLFFFPDIHDRT